MKVTIDDTVSIQDISKIVTFCEAKGIIKPHNVSLIYFDLKEILSVMLKLKLNHLGLYFLENDNFFVLIPKKETTQSILSFS